MNILLVLCIFLTVWMGIIFVGSALAKTLGSGGFPWLNVLIFALSITGIITHAIGMW